MIEINVVMNSGDKASLSFQQNLIMLHSTNISAQWPPNNVGVQVERYTDFTKVSFQISRTNELALAQSHQGFMFHSDEYDKLVTFFKALSFPEQCFTDIRALELAAQDKNDAPLH